VVSYSFNYSMELIKNFHHAESFYYFSLRLERKWKCCLPLFPCCSWHRFYFESWQNTHRNFYTVAVCKIWAMIIRNLVRSCVSLLALIVSRINRFVFYRFSFFSIKCLTCREDALAQSSAKMTKPPCVNFWNCTFYKNTKKVF